MKKYMIPTKKLNNGFEMPVLGLGTWLVGGDKLRNPNNDDLANVKGIKKAIEMGISHIDTAENYAEGHAEKLVGQAIKGFDRKKLFITSKVDKRNLAYNDLLIACKKSLERLKTSYLDLYLIHSPNDEIPIDETFRAIDELVNKGLVKNIGVSNFKTKRLASIQNKTKNKIVTNQVYYNLIIREPEIDGLVEYCQDQDIFLTTYRPLELGNLFIAPIIKELSDKYGKTPFQIAINWLVSQDKILTITKMLRIEHIKENLGALNWQMENRDIEKLRIKFPGQKEKSDILPLK
ncbi:aldo/keto reductase [Patescibacteria group bacterium]|nr:aldo/keto reductase [Patescibacteria group bacterium]MCG2701913.1 aldo/keto reductase [Candidatus Parcubacteria bacterium]MBU4265193.1 aldo/keto reductase [Patescibacteria group bacterium]MBU4390757.1 aldo/keto reductase [Patescibacteria group bacterium]MBU4397564.1 aldo/keto reductase [Patescibacteria group bacterium]